MLHKLDSGILLPDGKAAPPGIDLAAIATSIEGNLWRDALAQREKMTRVAIGFFAASPILGFVVGRAVGTLAGLLLGCILVICGVVLVARARAVRPGERVSGVSRAYACFAALPLEGDAAIYDLSGLVPATRVRIPSVGEASRLRELAVELENAIDGAAVLEPESERRVFGTELLFGSEARAGRAVTELNERISKRELTTLEVPIVPATSTFGRGLREHFSKMTEGDFGPVMIAVEPETVTRLNNQLEGIQSDSRNDADLDDVLREINVRLESIRYKVSALHQFSLGVLTDVEVLATYTSSWPAVAYYCRACALAASPDLAQPHLSEAFRVNLDMEEGRFRCPMCGAAVDDSGVIFLNRFESEVFLPLYEQVLTSIHANIVDIDRDIENQTLQLEREQGVKLEETRLHVEQEYRKRVAQVRQYRVQALGLKSQVDGMASTLETYQKLSLQRAEQFQRDAAEINTRIEQRIHELVARAEEEHRRHQQAANAESESRAAINREEEVRRHQAVVSQLQSVNEGLQEVKAASVRSAEIAEKSLIVQMSTPEEREAWKPSSLVNPLKTYSRWAARRHIENRISRI